jgi:ubiquinone/menaquinone biosynthesis C-methylase UbiE
MNPVDLLELFGPYAPLIVSLAALFLASVIVIALRQGRSVSIWPPRIGPHPRTNSARPGDEASTDRLPQARESGAVVDRSYTADRAKDFYQEIAPYYDLRNSGNLVSTHLETVAQIQAIRSQRSILRVLDLGGGTGKLIAIHFFYDDAIWWTYVDACPAMAAEFRRNLAGRPLGENSEIVVKDFTLALQQLQPASYDIVLLSLVLSSMPTLPDFTSIARMLTPNGSLIVTDISPGYTRDNPLYKVPIDGAVVALRTTPVDPYEVIRRATGAGLRTTEQKPLGEGNAYYSFITTFTPVTVRPLDEERGDENLVRA